MSDYEPNKKELIDFILRFEKYRTDGGAGQLSAADLEALAEGINERLRQFSLESPTPGAKALLYTGLTGKTESYKIAPEVAKASLGSLYTVDQTEMGKIINSDDFRAALIKASGSADQVKALMGERRADGTRSRFSVGQVLSIGDFMSERFAFNATGDVVTITSEIATDKVFASTELPALLANQNIRSINGVPVVVFEDLVNVYGRDEAMSRFRKLVITSSIVNSGSLTFVENGKLRTVLEVLDKDHGHDELMRMMAPGGDTAIDVGLRIGGHISKALDLISLFGATYSATKAARAGDSARAVEIMGNWSAGLGGNVAGGELAGFLSRQALMIIFGEVTIPYQILTAIGAAVIGGKIGENAVEELALFTHPQWDRDRLIEFASQSNERALATRHALKYLNVFASLSTVPIDTAGLEMYDPLTGEGSITPTWISTRAEMALYYKNYWQDGKPDGEINEIWSNLSDGLGDLIFSDASIPGIDTLTVDRLGADNRYVRFGGNGPEVLSGAGEDDRLFGGGGGDTLVGFEGADYLEGGLGDDTYVYRRGDGRDVILDVGGNDHIVINDEEIEGTFSTTMDPRHPDRNAWSLEDVDESELLLTLVSGTLEDGTLEITGSRLGTGGSISIEHFSSGQFGFDLGALDRIKELRGKGELDEGNGIALLMPLSGRAQPGQVVRFTVGPAFDELVRLSFGGNNYDFNADGVAEVTLEGGERSLSVVLLSSQDIEQNTTFTLSAVLLDAAGDPIPGSGTPKQITISAVGEPAGAPVTNYTIQGDQEPLRNSNNVIIRDQWGNIIPIGPAPGRNDNLFGTSANDLLLGGDGTNYYVTANQGGRDRIVGGSWMDIAIMGSNDDVAIGGNGRDRLEGAGGNDRIYAVDEVTEEYAIARGVLDESGTDYGDLISGAAGNDLLIGSADRDIVSGGAGSDMIIAGAGDDHILGDLDTFPFFDPNNYDPAPWSVTLTVTPHGGPHGSDLYSYVIENSAMYPSAEPDGDDTIYAGAGNDSILAGGGDDLIYGETGNDVIFASYGSDVVFGGTGDDNLIGGVFGDAQVDEDFLFGGIGNDILLGYGGNDQLFGGTDNDLLYGDAGDEFDGKDRLDGGDGNDELFGGGRADVLIGGAGNDKLYGDDDETPKEMAGADIIDGGAGNDFIAGFGGADIIEGGDGDDEISGDGSVVADAFGKGDKISGGNGDDLINGGGGDDSIYGDAGDDELYGDTSYTDIDFLGDDFIDGGEGNDTIVGHGGADTLMGGKGDDVILGDGANVTPIAAQGNDLLHGGDGRDTLQGDGGNDLLYGDAGDDLLFGGEGDDLLVGGDGADQLQGGAGNDILVAESSDDFLIGGAGDDIYVITSTDARFSILDTEGHNTLILGDGVQRGGAHLQMSGGRVRFIYGDNQYSSMNADTFASFASFDFGDGRSMTVKDLHDTFQPGATANPFLQLASGVSAWDIGFRARGNDLILVYSGAVEDWFDGQGMSDYNVLYRTEDRTLYGLEAGGPDVLVLSNWYLANTGSYLRFLFGGNDGSMREFEEIALGLPREVIGDGRDNSFEFDSGAMRVSGLDGNDTIATAGGQDVLDGGAGDDSLESGGADDELIGGAGDDRLWGGSGNDRYRYGAGDGADFIIDESGSADVLAFGPGIAPTDLTLSESLLGLEVRVGAPGAGNSIFISYDTAYSPSIEQFEFEDGTTWDAAEIDAHIAGNRAPRVATPLTDVTLQIDTAFSRTIPANTFFDPNVGDALTYTVTLGDGSALPAWLNYDAGTRTLSGRPGFNDAANLDIRVTATDPLGLSAAASFSLNIPPLAILTGTAQDDTLTALTSSRTILRGLEGNDNLTGNTGDDILEGGPGTDYLNGGLGNDTYLWSRGDGTDMLSGLIAEPASHIDTIQFGAGIAPADVRVQADFRLWLWVRDPATGRETAAFSIASGTDSAYGPKAYDRVRFADGTVWSFNETVNRGFVGGDRDDSFYGNDAANIMVGNGGDDWLRGFNGNDDLRGGTGRDQLDGGAGNDTYRFARGDGYDEVVDSQGTNRIVLDAGILPSEVTLYRETGMELLPSGGGVGSDDLILVLNGGQQQIRVEEYYSTSTPTNLSEIAFGDGTVWNAAAIAARLITNPTFVDTFTGTAGANSFAVDNARDRINDPSADDGDTVTSTTNYSLGTNVENLTLSGMFAIGGFGNNLVNTITGNEFANLLDGFAGLDTLIGGAGDDKYVVRQANTTGWNNGLDIIVEGVNGGYDTVLADRIYTAILPDNVEALIATGTSIYNFATQQGVDQRRKLVGNALDNVIDASGVSDVGVSGLVIDGGAGADLMIGPYGRIGPVRYVIDNVGDQIVFNGFSNPGSGGSNTVETIFSYTAGDDVQHIDLTGTAATSATGNEQDNQLSGINNTAANVLTGGRGNDTYFIGLGDAIVENAGEGIDSVLVMAGVAGSEIDLASYANVENLSIGTDLGAASVRGDSRDNILRGNHFGNVLMGGAGNDTIYAGSGIPYDYDTGIDTLLGGAGNDMLIADGNDDIFDGGSGDDFLRGIGRNYEYRFGFGSGFDLIAGTATSGLVRIREGVTASDIRAARDGSMLHVYISSSDRVSFENVYGSDESDWTLSGTVPSLVLADWTTFNTAALAALAQAASGVPSGYDDVVTGTAGADRLELLGGNDTVDAGAGNDIVVGGAGNDTLRGNGGDDVYRYSAGFGQDIIEDSAGSAQDAGIDVVEFDASIARSSVSFAHGANPDDLLISIANSADSITVRNFFAPGAASDQVELFRFADGTTVAAIELMGLPTLEGTNGADHLAAGAQSTLMYGRGGNDSLTGGAGNDLLDGGEGADLMAGGAGNDRYVVDQAGDAVTELAGAGIDTVESAITYSLGQQIENLTLIGAAATNATGNELDNTLRGNSAANVLNGGAGADTMYGGGGDDIYIVDNTDDSVVEADAEGVDAVQASVSFTLGANLENLTLLGSGDLDGTGNSDDNILVGTAGANVLDGGSGVDRMDGGAGDDTYVVTEGDTVVELAGGGVDEVRASVTYTLGANLENLTLLGSANIDGFGDAGNNVLVGNAGNNSLDGGAGADQMSGGAGNDTYYIDDLGDTIAEEADGYWDQVYSSISTTLAENVERVTLTGSDNLNATGNDQSNDLYGNFGNNILDGGAGADYMNGDAGNDVYYVDDVNDSVEDISGTDEVRSSATFSVASSNAIEILTLTGIDAIDGTGNALNNIITGNSAINQLTGGAGNDTLDGGAGADKLLGGQGNDSYVIDNTGDTITESSNQGTDVVTSSVTFILATNVEHLTLTGAANIDATGNSSGNTLTGNSGNNRLDGKAGTDTLVGGLGNDTYVVDSTTDTITELAGQGIDTVETTVTFSINTTALQNVIENLAIASTNTSTGITLTGNGLNNVLTGSSVANTLTGNDGDDTLNGLAGNDTLSGGIGNDILDGGTGNDGMTGGAGDDTYFVDSTTDTVTEASGGGTDTIKTTVQLSTWAANVENMTLLGTSALNVTSAMASSANNVIIGNSAVNSLNGGAGDDTLNGMGGNDTLTGGLGADTYQYSSGGGSDTIDNASTDALVDRLRFLDMASTQVRFTKSGNHLVMVDASNASNIFMTAQNWFSVASSKLDFVNFTNKEVTAAQIDALFASGGSGGVLSVIAPSQARIASPGATQGRELLDDMDSPQVTTLAGQAMAAEAAALVSRVKDAPIRWEPIKDFGQASMHDVGLDRLLSAMASFDNEKSLDVGVSPNHEIIECGLAVGAAPESEVHMIRSPMMGRMMSTYPEMIA